MRRGSVQTWEPLARRQSSNMAQFGNSRSEFMTSDLGLNDIEYERKGGFFMTHKKTAIVISVFVVVIIAAGFIGAYIGSIPKEKVYDTLALIDSDVGCDPVVSSKFSLSESISPSRYRIELSPIIEGERVTKLRGHVSIEFRYNATTSLSKLVMNAKHVNLTRVTLVSGPIKVSEDFKSRRKRLAMTDDTTMDSPPNKTAQILTNETVEDFSSTLSSMNKSEESVSQAPKLDQLTNSTFVNTTEIFSNETETGVPTVSTSGTSSTTEMPIKNETREIVIDKHETDKEAGFLVLHPKNPLKSDQYLLTMDYEVPINGYLIYPTNTSENNSLKWMAASRIRPTRLVNFFPAFDDVRMKARFSLSLPRLATMNMHSNMPLKITKELSDNWVLDTFEETPPIAPENLAATVLEKNESLGVKIVRNTTINFWGENLQQGSAQFLIDKIESVFESLGELFGANLHLPKLDVIGLQHGDYSSGYPGLITIQESLFDVKNDSPKVTKEYALMNLVNLMGKQWLGGLVNTQSSSDVWILESSLLYLQHRLVQEIYPELNHSTFIMDVQPDTFEVAGYSVSRSLASSLDRIHLNSLYTSEAYEIGACLISMLHGALRPMEYRDGYGSFVSRWSGGNANVASFWKAMTVNSSADKRPEGGGNLPEIMNLWSTENGYPVVTVTRNYQTGSATVHQARFSYDKPSQTSQQLWHIPLSWMTSDNSSVTLQWIKNVTESKIDLGDIVTNGTSNETWIVFNPTKTGYYRVNYDKNNWRLLAKALQENHEIFPPTTRAALIDDVFSLGFIRSIPYSLVFDVIDYLSENEGEPEPWTYLLQHTIKLNLVLYDSPQYFEYQDRMMKYVSRLYERVGSRVNKGPRLTMIAHQLACMFDYPAYLTWAKESSAGYESWPGLPIKEDIPSYLRGSLLCAFAKLNNQLGWQWWEQKFGNVTNREERRSLLSSLACFQVPSMLQAVLNEIVYSMSFSEDDALVILKSFSIYPPAAQTALKFVQSNWNNITRRYPKSCKIVTAFLDASCTGFTGEKDIEDFQSFKAKHYESLKKVGYVTALLEAKANASVSFITSLPDNPIAEANATNLQVAGIIQNSQTLDLDT